MTKVGLLFDLDGTLVDTDPLHLAAYRSLLRPLGRDLSADDYKTRIMGAPNDAIVTWLLPGAAPSEHQEFIAAKEMAFRSLVHDLEPTRGARRLLAWADEQSVEMAVVTNAPRANAELMLKGIGLDRFLSCLVIGDELPAGKPDPLPYRRGLEIISCDAENCIAFEDSLSGVRSAAGAGIFTYGLSAALPRDALLSAGASAVIADFEAEALWERLERWAGHGQDRASM